jgi:TM2 domain-containing membrane protein YozV
MAVLSGLCLAGVGQMILGQVGKGVVILLGSIALGALTAGLSAFVTLPLAAIDAYCIAKKLQDGKPVGQWEWF